MEPQEPSSPSTKKASAKKTQSMSMGKSALYALLVLVVIAGLSVAIYYIFRPSTSKTTLSTSSVVAQPTSQVDITSSGFNPATITINVGNAVKWVNTDTAQHQVASDPYPADNALPGLNGPVLSQNDSMTFTFDKTGTYTYHDQLNPYTLKGTIVVKP